MADSEDMMATDATDAVRESGDPKKVAETELALVKRVLKRVAEDLAHHKEAFDRMREDMIVARTGAEANYPVDSYKANLAGRHVKQKTAALYAKNPKAQAKRRETIDFTVWDENPASLQTAMQTLMQMQQVVGQLPRDPGTGQPSFDSADPQAQQMIQAAQASQEIVADFQQGMQRRRAIQKLGRTLEILFAHGLREQKPVDFKTGMKQVVRRTSTTGVGYVEIGFQREKGPRPAMLERLADHRQRLDHLKRLAADVTNTENPVTPDDPEIAELEFAIAALQAEPEVVLREGVIYDYPRSTKVIPDKLCRELVGFVGARWITLEYMYTCDQVKELFGVDLGSAYKGYAVDGKPVDTGGPTVVEGGEAPRGQGMVRVLKQYDKEAGVVYYVAEGYDKFLRSPAKPDVFVEDFWPVYALTFNAVESETDLFPPSDVRLMLPMQMEYNRSRQGLREHRIAARPRWIARRGAIENEDLKAIAKLKPFETAEVDIPENMKVEDAIAAVQVPGVDNNLYDTNPLFADIQYTVGSSEAQFGGVSKATATESAIAANSTTSSDNSSIDDLDSFLTVIARASGQIYLKEMSEEQVKAKVGVGAFWPHMTLAEIADEVYLEVAAGSTGKPNQAVEIDNLQKVMPFLLQIPGIDPTWLAKDALRRMDDSLDLTEALAAGAPSIMAANAMAQAPARSAGDPASDPAAQGPKGADNAPRDNGAQRGSEPAFGSNQV